jgi:hypothetical protein
MSRFGRIARVLLALACVFAQQAGAQYDVEPEERVWLRALLDFRVARGPAEPSWTDHGPGKTRFGGRATDGGFERVTRAELAQLAIELGAALPWGLRGQVQVNVQHDIADDYNPWLVEALLRKEWSDEARGFGLQMGVMTVPFALEHGGPAWTPERTISASALNTWLWEELTFAGLEAEWWRETRGGLRLGFLAGAGAGPDLFGRLLALRGWAMGDNLGGLNGDLPLPNGTRTDLFDERDGRPAVYALATIGDAEERATFTLGALDNGGDQDEEGVWRTRLATIGATLHPHPSVDVVLQYLDGEARVREPANDSDLRAYYGLVSFRLRDHRFSVRYDDFRVDDVDGGNPTGERGEGFTAAYAYQWGLRHRIGLEHVWLDSRRPENASPELASDGWQVSYRYRY